MSTPQLVGLPKEIMRAEAWQNTMPLVAPAWEERRRRVDFL